MEMIIKNSFEYLEVTLENVAYGIELRNVRYKKVPQVYQLLSDFSDFYSGRIKERQPIEITLNEIIEELSRYGY